MDDLLSEFLTETNESLAVLDIELVKLEQNPNNPDLLGNIFRLMHTIKGTCGFLGLPRLESVAHAGENVLGKLRDGDLAVDAAAVSLILECLDQIRSILLIIEQSESEPEGDDTDLIARLNALADSTEKAPPAAPEAQQAASDAAADISAEPSQETVADVAAPAEPASQEQTSEEPEAQVEPAEMEAEAPVPSPDPAPSAVPDPAPPPAPSPEPAPSAANVAKKPAGEAPAPQESSVANQSIRVTVDVLENLMTLVSELVLTRNQCLQLLRAEQDSAFAVPLQRLNHVVSELQDGVMKTRMQPIGNAWAKLPRIIRDLSLELDKKIDLVMKGADTELDRQVLELIKDPLTHMVRNSADHGLESTKQRLAAGKPEKGTVLLNAFHEGGHIIIEISDNGKGLPVEKLKEKILQNGLATELDIASMTDKQIMQHIFKPGFSTAAKVTSVSGRGVGMDVVRTNIEKIGGTIELTSVEGKGTKFLIKIPLTLAIVSALVVESGKQRFAIPQLSVVELVRAASDSEHRIEQINDTPVLRLRNRLLPLVSLRDLLRLPPSSEDENEPGEATSTDGFIVVAQVGAYSFGIIVDRVFDTEEIVVKPVAPILRNTALYSGNTILGDGSVVMILDPNGIAAATGEVSVSEPDQDADIKARASEDGDGIAMLVFRVGSNVPKAVQLSLVARLEEIDLTKVERSNQKYVVQYRGRLMPLVQMNGATELPSEGRAPVLVFAEGERSMGLVVDEIIDIVEDNSVVELSSDHAGLLGSAILDGQATEIIDTAFYLTRAFQNWFEADKNKTLGDTGGSRVLVIDDSPFFRNLLEPLLSAAGYDVTAVNGADQALELCNLGKNYDVIVSDIEMPGTNGYELAEMLKSDSRWSNVPLVALSSHATPRDIDRGRTAGFDDYVAKSDREALLRALEDTLSHTRGAA